MLGALLVAPRKHDLNLYQDCGLTTPPSVLVIIFAPLTLVHVMIAIYVIFFPSTIVKLSLIPISWRSSNTSVAHWGCGILQESWRTHCSRRSSYAHGQQRSRYASITTSPPSSLARNPGTSGIMNYRLPQRFRTLAASALQYAITSSRSSASLGLGWSCTA